MKALTISVFMLALAGCEQDESFTNPSKLAADNVIFVDDASYGCEFESKFQQAVDHYERKELSAWSQIVNDAPWCFYGGSLRPGQTWTVLQIRGAVMQIAQTTSAQYDTDPTRYKHSYWTKTSWGKLAS